MPKSLIFLLSLALLVPIGATPPSSSEAASPAPPAAPLKVVATVPTYSVLAKEIGGDLVDVVLLCRPSQDMHGVAATPSQMGRVRGADLLLYTGLDSELWLIDLLRGSANTHLLPGSAKAVALSDGLPLEDLPASIERSQGDVHAWGNPHLWADPYDVRAMAARVRDALVKDLPEHADVLRERHSQLHQRLTEALVGWLTKYKHLQGQPVVTYHLSWTYFLKRFGLELVGTIEPKPRVAPTASHLERLLETMKARNVKLILREPFQHPDATDFLAERTGATVLELSTHPGFPEDVQDIVRHFEYNLEQIDRALGGAHEAGGDG